MYTYNNNIVRVIKREDCNLKEYLDAGVYILFQNKETREFFLKRSPNFTDLEFKIFGNNEKQSDKIISTFYDRTNKLKKNTGVLLSGFKGSGKTLLTKLISKKLEKDGISTIIIDTAFNTKELSHFLQSLEGKFMILFDEFDKVYSEEYDDENAIQEGLLNLFDGSFDSEKLFILCCNRLHNINEFMLSRPSRIFYHFKFGSLTEEIIKEVCEHRNISDENTKQICLISHLVSGFSFDMLFCLIEEIERYNDSAVSSLMDMNIDINSRKYYDVDVIDVETNQSVIDGLVERTQVNIDLLEMCGLYVNQYVMLKNISDKVREQNAILKEYNYDKISCMLSDSKSRNTQLEMKDVNTFIGDVYVESVLIKGLQFVIKAQKIDTRIAKEFLKELKEFK